MFILPESLNVFLRFCLAYLVIFGLFLMNVVFFNMPLTTALEPPLFLMVIYYWSIYRPTFLPIVFVFTLGICMDLIGGFPVGLNAFIFLVLRQAVFHQRLFLMGQTFMVIWFGFVLLSFIATILQWFLFGLINLQWTAFAFVFPSIVFGICLFPFVALLLGGLHRILPDSFDHYSVVK